MMNLKAANFFLFISTSALILSGCTVAVPDVKSLLSQIGLFKLNDVEKRISSLSELSAIQVNGSCDVTNTGIDYELPDDNPGVWTAVPASTSGMFTMAQNTCTSNSSFSMTVDLTSIPGFAGMALGDSRRINFRDKNLLNLSTTQQFTVTYSQVSLSENNFVQGQGYGQTLTSGSYTLKGRIVDAQNYNVSTSGSYTLQGKASFR